ncbi:MAG: 3-methyl-2-oxobutanoate hydroxymethyltransferase [Ardenticatenaceae bacterium]|nr:3-methyl-2-oxobutanoate hydroxymethyltransferase [Ardenticatenaceae bacterium]
MDSTVVAQIQKQYEKRSSESLIGLKINLYTHYEVEAVSDAFRLLREDDIYYSPDCFMIGDSFLTTHLGYGSTKLSTPTEQSFFFKVMCELVYEVKSSVEHLFVGEAKPFIVADMPDGSTCDNLTATKNAEQLIKFGADVIKIEVASSKALSIVENLCRQGILVMAHIGYTPQTSENRLYGSSLEEVLDIFNLARQLRDCGISSLVIERVAEIVNQSLCVNRENSLPVYSIFSGKSPFGGQSLNVWDSVFLPPFQARFFPPTAKYGIEKYPEMYSRQIITQHFTELLRLTILGDYPLSPPQKLSFEDIEKIRSINPWKNDSCVQKIT